MKTFKSNRQNRTIKLDGVKFRPYTVGALPPSFGFKVSDDGEKEGISNWFNYKGLTYIKA